MSKTHWKIQALIFGVMARIIPTCFLQSALKGRDGVTVAPVRHDEEKSVMVRGPCVITVNKV